MVRQQRLLGNFRDIGVFSLAMGVVTSVLYQGGRRAAVVPCGRRRSPKGFFLARKNLSSAR